MQRVPRHEAATQVAGATVRQKLHTWSALSLLAVAGVAFSAAAIALIVGTSQAQLAAARGNSTDLFSYPCLFSYPWSLAGLSLAAVGAIWGWLAIWSARTQSADRRSPSLSLEIGTGVYELETDSKTYTKLSVRVRNISRVPLYDVRLLLLGGNPVKTTYYLRAEYDDADPFTRSVMGSLCPVGESIFFQVAEMSEDTEDIALKYAHNRLPDDRRVPVPTDPTSTFLMLRAEARRGDNNDIVFSRADVGLFMVFGGPGGLRLKKRDTVLEGTR